MSSIVDFGVCARKVEENVLERPPQSSCRRAAELVEQVSARDLDSRLPDRSGPDAHQFLLDSYTNILTKTESNSTTS